MDEPSIGQAVTIIFWKILSSNINMTISCSALNSLVPNHSTFFFSSTCAILISCPCRLSELIWLGIRKKGLSTRHWIDSKAKYRIDLHSEQWCITYSNLVHLFSFSVVYGIFTFIFYTSNNPCPFSISYSTNTAVASKAISIFSNLSSVPLP